MFFNYFIQENVWLSSLLDFNSKNCLSQQHRTLFSKHTHIHTKWTAVQEFKWASKVIKYMYFQSMFPNLCFWSHIGAKVYFLKNAESYLTYSLLRLQHNKTSFWLFWERRLDALFWFGTLFWEKEFSYYTFFILDQNHADLLTGVSCDSPDHPDNIISLMWGNPFNWIELNLNWFGYNYLLVIVCPFASKQHDLSITRTRRQITPMYSSPTNPAVYPWQLSRTFQSKTGVHKSNISVVVRSHIHRKYYYYYYYYILSRFLWCNKPFGLKWDCPVTTCTNM